MEQENKTTDKRSEVMEALLERLRKFYLYVSIPALPIFALFYFLTDEAVVTDAGMQYYSLVGFFLLALIAVPVSSFMLKRAVSKGAGKSDEVQAAMYEKAYRLRLWVLNGLAYLSGPLYMISGEEGCVWMFAIAVVVVLLSYPSHQYVIRDREK